MFHSIPYQLFCSWGTNNWMFHTPKILEHRSIKLAITSHTKACNAKVMTHLINLFTIGIELQINIVELKT